MFKSILQHLHKMRLFFHSSLYTKKSKNSKIKLISFLVDEMRLMIWGELEIVRSEEHPTYKVWLLNKGINKIERQENIIKVKNGNKLNEDMFLDLLCEGHLSLQLPSFENLK